jgi:hypothetical protein
MAGQHTPEEDVPPPMVSIDGLWYSPTTDLPFGKRIRLGQREHMIYQSSVEDGYHMGLLAHLHFAEANGLAEPIMLDDRQFTMVIEQLVPEGLALYDRGLWRSHFIAGWTSVYLGVASREELDGLLEEE